MTVWECECENSKQVRLYKYMLCVSLCVQVSVNWLLNKAHKNAESFVWGTENIENISLKKQ